VVSVTHFRKSLADFNKISGLISGKVKKIEAQAKRGFPINKTCYFGCSWFTLDTCNYCNATILQKSTAKNVSTIIEVSSHYYQESI